MEDLDIIAEYIVHCIAQIAQKDIIDCIELGRFIDNVSIFTRRLIADPVNVVKDILIEKASKQLLCCIGIDLMHNIVSSDFYYSIFKTIDYDNKTLYARRLFHNAITNSSMHYKNPIEQTSVFRIIIRPIKDWHFYIDPTSVGLYGASHKYMEKHDIISAIKSTKPQIKLDKNKMTRNSEYKYFWATTIDDFNNAVNYAVTNNIFPKCISNCVIDGLGLSHYSDFSSDPWSKDFFYIDLGGFLSTFCYKPNATIVPWDIPTTGYLSKQGLAGSTWSITGTLPFVMSEKVFNEIIIADIDINKVVISLLPDSIIPPIDINPDALINEGITRFFK